MSQNATVVSSRLAIDGGEPVIPAGRVLRSRWPRVEAEELVALANVIRTGMLTEMAGRQAVQSFETDIALWTGVRYALTTNSGTAALHCALAGLGVSAGDEVIVPALSYIACAAAVIHHHAIPVLADVDPKSYNLTADTVAPHVTPRTRAIIAVHLHGLPVEMDALLALGKRHGIPVLEDFSQAVGASYHGKRIGSLGAAGAASLMAGKNLPAAGEGGVVVTNDRTVRNRAAALKCFGESVGVDGTHELIHATLGYNYRINILSAVMASQQLFHLERFTRIRNSSARRLDERLRGIPGFSPPPVPNGVEHAYHMYRFRFEPREAGLSITSDQAREAIKLTFAAEGLSIVEFQNAPLASHALLQRHVGFGHGCPWTCHGRADMTYRAEDYPGALDAIRHSLVVGMPSQATLANPEAIESYLHVFDKLARHLRAFERFASTLPSSPPWTQPARLF
ncbi:MAG: DegT/DnrJ/EryC1/StrS family aminotransferase [Deltaproteobacteria bacterium]|nr:DegT/DnrJ/EryC1/StrS family aminotransferase [Deltaproteobacteria bacterium]